MALVCEGGVIEYFPGWYLRGHSISKETIANLAQQEQLSPAQIEKAAKVLKLSDATPETREATLLLVVENSMALLEQDKIDPILNLAACSYQLDYLNPDCDLTQLVAQLKRAPDSTGALCFYGEPGTGNTALAHYIAREIELPLLVRRASDILSPYVGEPIVKTQDRQSPSIGDLPYAIHVVSVKILTSCLADPDCQRLQRLCRSRRDARRVT